MAGEAPTKLIERDRLRVLIAASASAVGLAHTVPRRLPRRVPIAEAQPQVVDARPPSALRGLVLLLVVVLALRMIVSLFL